MLVLSVYLVREAGPHVPHIRDTRVLHINKFTYILYNTYFLTYYIKLNSLKKFVNINKILLLTLKNLFTYQKYQIIQTRIF